MSIEELSKRLIKIMMNLKYRISKYTHVPDSINEKEILLSAEAVEAIEAIEAVEAVEESNFHSTDRKRIHLEPVIPFTKILENPELYLRAMYDISLIANNLRIYDKFVINLEQAYRDVNAEVNAQFFNFNGPK